MPHQKSKKTHLDNARANNLMGNWAVHSFQEELMLKEGTIMCIIFTYNSTSFIELMTYGVCKTQKISKITCIQGTFNWITWYIFGYITTSTRKPYTIPYCNVPDSSWL